MVLDLLSIMCCIVYFYMPYPSLTPLLASVAPELVATRQYLLNLMPAQTQPLMESVGYSLGVSGKMIRPAMALLATKALRETNQAAPLPSEVAEKAIALSAVAEMIHLATLLHDDVLDDANLRRGQATTRFQFGNKLYFKWGLAIG